MYVQPQVADHALTALEPLDVLLALELDRDFEHAIIEARTRVSRRRLRWKPRGEPSWLVGRVVRCN
ncbi:MAG: hypothetical protein ABI895_29315 [Deltaproteobacteria bacterium]